MLMKKIFFLITLLQAALSFAHEKIPVRILASPSQVPILKQYEEVLEKFRKPWPMSRPRLGHSYWDGSRVVEEKPIGVVIKFTSTNKGYPSSCPAPKAEIRHTTDVQRTYVLDREKHARYWKKIKEISSGVTAGIGLIPLTPAYGAIVAGKLAQKAGRIGHAEALKATARFTRIEKDTIRTVLPCPSTAALNH